MNTPSTFGDRPATARARAWRAGTAVVVLVVATIVTIALSRRGAVPEDTMAGHDHAAATQAPAGPASVSLSAAQAARIGVTYAAVTREVVTRDVRAVGLVTADEARVQSLSLKVDGWVESLYVNVTGQRVALGAPLLALYSPMLVAAEEELLLALRLADQVAGADSAARASADALLRSSRERLAYWDVPAEEIAAIERDRRARRTITIRSRGAGHVLEKRVVEGQRVMAGEALFRVANLEAVWVEADVFAQDLADIRLGQRVDVEFEGFTGQRRAARITFIQPTVDAQSRTVRVRAELSNADSRLLPGMYATIRFSIAPGGATLSIPRSAVLATGERALVFVREADGRLVARAVQLGRSSDRRVEVLQGLQLGDVVVASATFLVDAESSLQSLAGGSGAMADMPGMTMEKP